MTRFQRIIGFSLFVLLIIGLTIFVLSDTGSPQNVPPPKTVILPTAPLLAKELPVDININEYPPGKQVTVGEVFLDQPGYVVIYEALPENAPGQRPATILGFSAILPSGRSERVPVPLSRTVGVGESLTAMLHRDDGNDMLNIPGSDEPILREGGTFVMKTFTIEED